MIVTVVPPGPWNMGKLMGAWFLFTSNVSASVAWVVRTIVSHPGDEHAGVTRRDRHLLADATGAVELFSSAWPKV
jgi:hypothetical protein